jgi:DNA-binding IclR family transcriptional regulator
MADTKTGETAPEKRQRNPLQHSFEIMEVLSRSKDALSLHEIANHLAIHKSTVHRLLATLVEQGYLERDRMSRYALGPGLIALAGAALERNPIAQVAQPILDEIARLTRETVTLSVWNVDHAVDIAVSAGLETITYSPTLGQRNPAHCTATGKVFLASLPQDRLDAYLAKPLKRFTDRTITDPDELRALMVQVRETGLAWNAGEFAEQLSAVAIGVPANDAETILAAIAVSVPDFRLDDEKRGICVDALRMGAAALSARTSRMS